MGRNAEGQARTLASSIDTLAPDQLLREPSEPHTLPSPFAEFWHASQAGHWGVPAGVAEFGSIAVLVRNGGGHVAIVTGVSADGKHARLLGGNQGDAVCESWFPTERVIAYRKQADELLAAAPVAAVGALSKSEA